MEELIDPESFDAIILGTGFEESVVAGALSLAGKKVLHLDCSEVYGSHCASVDLGFFEPWVASQGAIPFPQSSPDSSTNNVAAAASGEQVTSAGPGPTTPNAEETDGIPNARALSERDDVTIGDPSTSSVLATGQEAPGAGEAATCPTPATASRDSLVTDVPAPGVPASALEESQSNQLPAAVQNGHAGAGGVPEPTSDKPVPDEASPDPVTPGDPPPPSEPSASAPATATGGELTSADGPPPSEPSLGTPAVATRGELTGADEPPPDTPAAELIGVAPQARPEVDELPLRSTADGSLYSHLSLYDWSAGESLGRPRQYSVDLCGPRVIHCGGSVVSLLVDSGASNYLEFKAIDGLMTWHSGRQELTAVPASRAEVFQDRSLSLVDKRHLMRFLKLVADLAPLSHTTPWVAGTSEIPGGAVPAEVLPSAEATPDSAPSTGGATAGAAAGTEAGVGPVPGGATSTQVSPFEAYRGQSFKQLLQSQKLPEAIQEYIMYAVSDATFPGSGLPPGTELEAPEGLSRMSLIFRSVGRFGARSGLIYPSYGFGELPQAFCRIAAVKGALYVLKRAVASLLVDKATGAAQGVRTKSGQRLWAPLVLLGPCFLPTPGGAGPPVSAAGPPTSDGESDPSAGAGALSTSAGAGEGAGAGQGQGQVRVGAAACCAGGPADAGVRGGVGAGAAPGEPRGRGPGRGRHAQGAAGAVAELHVTEGAGPCCLVSGPDVTEGWGTAPCCPC